MISILHIIGNMNDGGAQKIILNYINDFENDSDIKLSLLVLSSKTDHKYNKILDKYNVKVTYLNCFNNISFKPLRIIVNKYTSYKKILNYLKNNNFDGVHIHLFGTLKFSMYAILKTNIPIRFYTLHSSPSRFKGIRLKELRKAFKKGKFIPICVNKEQADFAKDYYQFGQYEIVHNGVDFDYIRSNIIPKENARYLFNLKNEFVVVAVGRLDTIKKFDYLIKVFNQVLKVKHNSILLIAGDGPEKNNLEKLVSELNLDGNVRFLGNINNVVGLYCAADVLAVTSKSESASLVLLEAQTCNLRCVISNGVPSESIITDKVQKMDESATENDWANALLNIKYKGTHEYDFKDYEVHSMSKKIKKIYLKYWEEYSNASK